jgi:hypothetical protein
VTNGPRGWSTWHPWVGTTNFDTLLPGGVATISFRQNEVPGAARRIRLVFQYFYDAGPLTKAAVHVVTNLPVGSLSPEVRHRLYQQGLLNGQHQRSYDGDWVSNSANGRPKQRAISGPGSAISPRSGLASLAPTGQKAPRTSDFAFTPMTLSKTYCSASGGA